MNITKKDLGKSQIELTVEMTAEEFKPYILRGAEKVSEQVKIEGFRPGKAPYEILKNNLQVYKIPVETTYLCDYVSVFKQLKQDVVYLDPPWGGPDYKKAKVLDLYLGEKNIIDICVELMTGGENQSQLATLIVLKLPVNYNLPGLIAKMPNRSFLTQKIYRCQNRHSYNVVFCW